MPGKKPIPVIDLFAGPGGLGEGFASLQNPDGTRSFRISVSIEKDPVAHRTLRLRSFYRQFERDSIPNEYYDFLRRCDIDEGHRWRMLKEKYPNETKNAESEARNAELGKYDSREINTWIRRATDDSDSWVLIGGPPCQAYSVAGRSRNSGNPKYVAEDDERQYLYKEYLRILSTHAPPLFIMENVKGLLSATLQDGFIFERILEDLRRPNAALGRGYKNDTTRYRIIPLTAPGDADTTDLRDYVVPMENFGIPQARHRIILLGIREDLREVRPNTLSTQDRVTVQDALVGLPPLRSGLSKGVDDLHRWRSAIAGAPWARWFGGSIWDSQGGAEKSVDAALSKIRRKVLTRGSEFIPHNSISFWKNNWYTDRKLGGICNHTSRSHVSSDLHRYFYAAMFAHVLQRSPTLVDFPRELLPAHKSTRTALKGGYFADRFRIQLPDRPATTITSHIAKDGHYYIHHDPTQCRSLTVREAARIQTFPDNYFFCGSRTSQYVQVGNAVPPRLARQIAKIAQKVLRQAGGD